MSDHRKSYAPWTPDEVKHLQAWQASPMVHPFTCCDHVTMNVEPRGFVCPKCGLVQTWCHNFMVNGPPPVPTKLWGLTP